MNNNLVYLIDVDLDTNGRFYTGTIKKLGKKVLLCLELNIGDRVFFRRKPGFKYEDGTTAIDDDEVLGIYRK